MIKVTVNGIFHPILADTLTIEAAIEERSTCTFVVRDENGMKHFRKGHPVKAGVFSGATPPQAENIYFNGVVESVERHVVAGVQKPETFWTVTCVDYHYSADKRLAAKAYINETSENIVFDLWDSYLKDEGISLGTIDAGPVIQEAVFNYVKLSECFDAMADRTGYWWRIDENKTLHFVRRGTFAAPFFLTGARCRADTIRLTEQAPKYRNQQVIKGSRDVTSVQTEVQRGDGEKQSFTVGFPLAHVPTVEISLGGGAYTAQTVGVKGVEGGRSWYWSSGDPTITQDHAAPRLTTLDRIRVLYQGEFPVVIISRDRGAILDRQKVEQSGTGIVEETLTQSETAARESTFQLAGQLLAKYGTVGRRLRFRTREEGLVPGQLLTVDLPDYGLEGREFLIEAVNFSTESVYHGWYDVSAIEGPEAKSWQSLFIDMVRRSDATLQVGLSAGEVIIIPYQFERDWLQTDVPNIFTEVYPSASLTPSNTAPFSFAPEDRVKALEWRDSTGPRGRKAVTQVTGADTAEIFSLTFLSPDDAAPLDIASFAWIGGIDAGVALGTGVVVDVQTQTVDNLSSPWAKTAAEAWQVEKTDRRWP